MRPFKVWDSHPGKHHHGKEMVLCMGTIVSDHEIKTFLTCVRHEGWDHFGMFDKQSAPIQVCKFDKGRLVFTMSNLGTITKKQEVSLWSGLRVIVDQFEQTITICRV